MRFLIILAAVVTLSVRSSKKRSREESDSPPLSIRRTLAEPEPEQVPPEPFFSLRRAVVDLLIPNPRITADDASVMLSESLQIPVPKRAVRPILERERRFLSVPIWFHIPLAFYDSASPEFSNAIARMTTELLLFDSWQSADLIAQSWITRCVNPLKESSVTPCETDKTGEFVDLSLEGRRKYAAEVEAEIQAERMAGKHIKACSTIARRLLSWDITRSTESIIIMTQVADRRCFLSAEKVDAIRYSLRSYLEVPAWLHNMLVAFSRLDEDAKESGVSSLAQIIWVLKGYLPIAMKSVIKSNLHAWILFCVDPLLTWSSQPNRRTAPCYPDETGEKFVASAESSHEILRYIEK